MALDDRSSPPDPALRELLAIRHDRLRRTAPAVQHEINNALMVLTSNLELLGRSVAEGPPRRQLDRASEAARRLEATIRGFLDAARREVSDIAQVSPAAAVKQALPLLRVVLGGRHAIEAELDPKAWEVLLDRARLDLALLALVRDAAQHMAAGAKIGVWVQNLAESGEVTLGLTLPAGAEPNPATAALLAGAARETGGRMERTPDGLALVWPKAAGRAGP
jgi:signal transduction histidine kinase